MEVAIQSNKQLNLLFNSNEATISLYKTEHQQTIIKSKISSDLIRASDLLNVGKRITADQIIMVASMIYEHEEFRTLKPCEIEECLKRGVQSDYGPLYDKLDANTIFFWLNEYCKQKTEAIELLRQKESGEHKQALKQMPQDKKVSEFGNQVLKTIQERLDGKIKAEKKKPAPTRERTPAELELDGYIAEFDALHKQQPANAKLFPKFVDYKKKKLSLEEYCNKRFEEVREV